MKRITTLVGSALMALACGCADGGRSDYRGERNATPAQADATPAAGDIVEAERGLDRGEDGARFKPLLEKALAAQNLTPADRSRAIFALSRVEEALGNGERAITLIEDEIAAHGRDHEWVEGERFNGRLRKLLTGHESAPGLRLESDEAVAPFAHVLLRYFPPSANGSVQATFYMAGGDSDVSDKLGTYNLRGALRAEKEKECPLCDLDVNVGRSTHQSGSWMVIPESQSKFGDALTVFYFDLARMRVPARYESHLPLKVADIVRELEAGKSFVVAKERPGAPPVLLIASPREAMMPDVEAKLAKLTELPLAPVYFDVSSEVRPAELRAVMGTKWRAEVRGCYKTLLAGRDDAHGHADIRLELAKDGHVTASKVETKDEVLRDASFLGCVAHAAEALAFPATGRDLTVVVPLELRH